MFGRDADVDAIAHRLRVARLMSVVGPGGIGKTTLVLACAEALEDSFADGVAFAEVTGGGPEMALAAALGLRFSEEAAIDALTAFIAPLELLVVLDSCEFAVEASAALAEAILRRSPASVVLCASREALGAEGEALWWIEPLASPADNQAVSAEETLAFSAVRLFVERAKAADQRFSPSDDEVAVVGAICRKLDGLPLAIELAAGAVSAFGLEGVEAALDSRFQLFFQSRRTAIPRHRTLSAAIDWSYDALGEAEQRAFRCLSLFQAGFDAASAAQLLSGDETEIDATQGVLSSLVAKSLLVADRTGTPGEFRLLDSTRAYAREKLDASGELNMIAARHATRTMVIFSKAESDLGLQSLGGWLGFFSRRVEDARTALDWAYGPGGDRSYAVPLTLAACHVWLRLARFEECWRRLEEAMAVVIPGTPDELDLILARAYTALDIANKDREASASCERAIALAGQLGDPASVRRATWTLWNVDIVHGRIQRAHKSALRFAELTRDAGLYEDLVADRAIGVTELLLGNLEEAREAIERVRTRSPGWDSREAPAWFSYDPDIRTRNTLVALLWLEGKPDSAEAMAQGNAARALRSSDHPAVEAVLADAVCGMAVMVGNHGETERRLGRLDAFVRQWGSPLYRRWAQFARAALAAGRGDVEPGLELIGDGFESATAHPSFAILLAELAERLGDAGEVEAARRLSVFMQRRIEESGEFWILSEVLRIRSQLAEDDDEARSLIDIALASARKQGAKAWELRAATSLARRWPRTAAEVLAPLADSFTEGFWTRDLVAARKVLGVS
jgi:predicted ATPase